jgi:hypothetical protein
LAALTLLGLMLLAPHSSAAQSPRGTTAASAPSHLPLTDDKTGTNPLNLRQIVTVSNHFASLPDALFVDTAAFPLYLQVRATG